MTALITATTGGATTSPLLVLGYEATAESQNVVHQLIGGGIAVTLAEANPRTGTLHLLYADEALAFACLALHRAATTFTLTGTSRTPLHMMYAVNGRVGLTLAENRKHWTVTVVFQEVLP